MISILFIKEIGRTTCLTGRVNWLLMTHKIDTKESSSEGCLADKVVFTLVTKL